MIRLVCAFGFRRPPIFRDCKHVRWLARSMIDEDRRVRPQAAIQAAIHASVGESQGSTLSARVPRTKQPTQTESAASQESEFDRGAPGQLQSPHAASRAERSAASVLPLPSTSPPPAPPDARPQLVSTTLRSAASTTRSPLRSAGQGTLPGGSRPHATRLVGACIAPVALATHPNATLPPAGIASFHPTFVTT